MSGDLLQTKLYVPRLRPSLVPRPRLIEKLNQGMQQGSKLTLISSPAGFGKTTLIADFGMRISESHIPHSVYLGLRSGQVRIPKFAWFSLDESDNDPVRFLAYFIAALNQIEGIHPEPVDGAETSIGQGTLTMLRSSQPPPAEVVLTPLINEIAAIPDKFILVLDDYHVIESSQVDDILAFLLENMPPQMHLVISSRADPRLPLSRLRVRGQLTELRAADLRFTSSEAAEFLNQVMGLDLSEEDIKALETRTEGWIAGLQLAAISLQKHADTSKRIQSFTGSHRLVLDYLIEEVMDQQPQNVQDFLLKTAVLNRLTGSLCDALTGQEDGQATLEMLEHANLFIIPLDDERRWYRYHHLFADLLRQRLRQYKPSQLPVLHRRASTWYEQNEFADESIEHALRGDDFERAAYLIEDQFGAMYERGAHTKLRHWLADLPVELICARPYLCILHAWNLFTSGQLDAADHTLQTAEKILVPNADQTSITVPVQAQLSDADRQKLSGMASAIRAYLASYSGDIPGTIEYARKALDCLPEQELPWRSAALIALGGALANKGDTTAAYKARTEALETVKATGDTYLLLIASLRMAETLRQQGKLPQIVEICQQQMQNAEENGLSETVVAGWLWAMWGETLAELNDLDKGREYAEKGAELTGRGQDLAMIGWSNLCLVRVLFSAGGMADAEAVIQKMENKAQKYDMPIGVPLQLSAWQARVWLAQGKLEAASQWVKARGLDATGDITYWHEMEYMALARILIAQERLEEASELLRRLQEAAEAGGRTSRVIEILALKALSLQAQGNREQALTALEKALNLAEPGGFVRTFVDEGPPMARLLQEALKRGVAPDYVRLLLAAFLADESLETVVARTQVDQTELVEPLSERELEILQKIAEGLTNREVAERLYLSLNTVKVHTRNIYGKLGVHNRTQAVTRARALGILPPI